MIVHALLTASMTKILVLCRVVWVVFISMLCYLSQGYPETHLRVWPFEKRSNYTCRPSFIDKDVSKSVSESEEVGNCHTCVICFCIRYSSILTASNLGGCLWRHCHLVCACFTFIMLLYSLILLPITVEPLYSGHHWGMKFCP